MPVVFRLVGTLCVWPPILIANLTRGRTGDTVRPRSDGKRCARMSWRVRGTGASLFDDNRVRAGGDHKLAILSQRLPALLHLKLAVFPGDITEGRRTVVFAGSPLQRRYDAWLPASHSFQRGEELCTR